MPRLRAYTYRHHPGRGSTDHLADEVIARAARILGLPGADAYVRQAAGYDAHAVPMPRPRVTLWGADARKRMEAALVEARAAMPCRVSCVIAVEEIDVRTMTASHERV